MTMTQAVVARTNELLAEKKMSKRDFYEASGLSKGTIGSIYKGLATKCYPQQPMKASAKVSV